MKHTTVSLAVRKSLCAITQASAPLNVSSFKAQSSRKLSRLWVYSSTLEAVTEKHI